jgi:hypothetical protein
VAQAYGDVKAGRRRTRATSGMSRARGARIQGQREPEEEALAVRTACETARRQGGCARDFGRKEAKGETVTHTSQMEGAPGRPEQAQ